MSTVEIPMSSRAPTRTGLRPNLSPRYPPIDAAEGAHREADAEGGEAEQHADDGVIGVEERVLK